MQGTTEEKESSPSQVETFSWTYQCSTEKLFVQIASEFHILHYLLLQSELLWDNLPITISQSNIQRLARKSGHKNSFVLYVLCNSSATWRCDTSVCILSALTGWPLFFNNDFPWLFHDQKKWISMTYQHSIFFRNKRYTIYECLPEQKYISSCSSISQ